MIIKNLKQTIAAMVKVEKSIQLFRLYQPMKKNRKNKIL
jgi:hypothetical protein